MDVTATSDPADSLEKRRTSSNIPNGLSSLHMVLFSQSAMRNNHFPSSPGYDWIWRIWNWIKSAEIAPQVSRFLWEAGGQSKVFCSIWEMLEIINYSLALGLWYLTPVTALWPLAERASIVPSSTTNTGLSTGPYSPSLGLTLSWQTEMELTWTADVLDLYDKWWSMSRLLRLYKVLRTGYSPIWRFLSFDCVGADSKI